MKNHTRRTFLAQSAAASSLLLIPTQPHAANDTVTIGIIGCGNRAQTALMQEIIRFRDEQNAEIVAVCDVWSEPREAAAKMVEDAWGKRPAMYDHYQKVLDDDSIDAVVIATPEHTHATYLTHAIKAGKDVYCEKPLAYTLEELRMCTDAVKASDRVVQIGTQLRSYPSFTGCKKVVQQGALGNIVKISQIRNSAEPYWLRYAAPIKRQDTHWDTFLHNKKDRPFDGDQHTAWYGYTDFSLGAITTMMCHYIDLVHYITDAKFPRSAIAMNGTYAFEDQRTQPDSVHTLLDYPEGFMVSFGACYGNGAGNYTRFQGTKGLLDATNWREPIISGEGASDENPIAKKEQVPDADIPQHMENWLQCLRTRNKPNADIEAGYQHAIATLLSYESIVQKRRMAYKHETREFVPA